MGIVIKQSAIYTFLTSIGIAIGYVNLIILFPMYMNPEEVGLVRIIQDAALLMVPFVQLGVSRVVLKYFPEHYKKEQYGEFAGLITSFLIVAILLFTVAFFVFKNQIGNYFRAQSPEAIQYLIYIFMLTIIMTINQVLGAVSQSILNIVLPNFLKEIVLRIFTLILIILFAIHKISFDQFVIILIGAYLLNAIIMVSYLASKGLLKIKFRISYFNNIDIIRMIKYAVFTFLAASGAIIVGKVDSLMVTGMLGLKETAIYTTAFYIAVVIELPKRAVAQISVPLISKAFKNNNMQEVKNIYSKSSINNLIIGLLIFIGLWINLDNIFILIPRSSIYSLGSLVVLIIGAGKLLDMMAGLNGEIIIMSKYYKVNVYLIVGLAIITILANFILIPIYGLNGAAIGSALALVLFNISKYIFLYIKFRFQPFSINTIKILVIGAITLTLGLLLPKLDNTYLDIAYRSSIVTAIFGTATYFFKISKEINELVNKFVRK